MGETKKPTRVAVTGHVKSFKSKTESLLGKEYTVLPAVMMVEGSYYPYVEDMSKAASLHFSARDLEQSVNTWNGRPVAVNHPDGQVTCNSPETFNRQWVGYVFNARYDRDSRSLKSDLWIEKERGSFIAAKANDGHQIDVSIGAFGDLIPSGNNDYDFSMRNIVGDHLAVLPDGVGACNWKDGCGIRAESYGTQSKKTGETLSNKGGENAMRCDEEKNTSQKGCDEETRGQQQEKDTQMKVEAKAGAEKKRTFNLEEWLGEVPIEARSYIKDSIKAYDRNRNRYIEKITNCKLVSFCKNDLGRIQDLSLLESISELIDVVSEENKKVVEAREAKNPYDYQLKAGTKVAASNNEEYATFNDIQWEQADYSRAN